MSRTSCELDSVLVNTLQVLRSRLALVVLYIISPLLYVSNVSSLVFDAVCRSRLRWLDRLMFSA